METSHIPDAPGCIFQNGMDIGAEFCRVNSSLFPLPCSQAIFQEVLQTAFRLGINLGGGQDQTLAVQFPDPIGRNGSQAVRRTAANGTVILG